MLLLVILDDRIMPSSVRILSYHKVLISLFKFIVVLPCVFAVGIFMDSLIDKVA